MAKKILTILLSAIMVASVVLFVVSCGGNNDNTNTTAADTTASRDNTTTASQDNTTTATVTEEDTTTEPETTVITGREKMSGYEDVDFGGLTFLISSNCDADDSWEDGKDFWVEAITNDAVNDAIYERNQIMHNLYNCDIQVDSGGKDNGYNADLASGGGKYIAATKLYGPLKSYVSGSYYNLLKLDIDLTQSYFDQNYINSFSVDGKLFNIVGDWSICTFKGAWIVFYNKSVYESKFADTDIYQMVRDKQWTWDAMENMMEAVKNDVNGDQQYTFSEGSDADILGFISTDQNAQGFYFATGERTIRVADDRSTLIPAIPTQKGSDVIDKMIHFLNVESYLMTGYTSVQTALQNGTTLFGGEVLDVLRRMSNAEDLRIGILPLPLLDENQDEYHCYVNRHAVSPLAVPTSYSDVDVVSDFLTLFAYHSSMIVRPAFINTYKYTYTSDEESAEMLDIILNSRVYDPGYLDEIPSISGYVGYISTMVSNKKNQYTKYVERMLSSLNSEIEELVGKIKAVDDNY